MLASRIPRGAAAWVRCAVSIVLAAPAAARADDHHYQSYVVGGRAMGLGGAYTALAEDSSGLFYNPAGIADLHAPTSYQISTSLYGFERGSYGEGALLLPVAGLESLRVEFTELVIVPASAGFVRALGEPGSDGKPVQAVGATVMVPSFRTFNVTDPPSRDLRLGRGRILDEEAPTYARRVQDRSLWAGVGYGRKINRWLRLGASAFYVLRTASDVESVTLRASINDGDGDPTNDQQVFRSATNDVSFLNGSVVLEAGAKLLVSDRVRLGFAVLSPSIPVHSESVLRMSLSESIPDCGSLGLSPERLAACRAEELLREPRSRSQSDTIMGSSETHLPLTLRLGGAYVWPDRLTLTADATLYMPTSYQLVRSPRLTEELRARLQLNPQVERRAVVNLNLGAEYLVVRQVSVAAGFFTDFSSAPPIPRAPQADAQPQVDMQGVTLALGYFGKHTLTRIGVSYSWGQGHDVIPLSDVGRILRERQGFQRVDYFQSFFYVFVSSTFRY